MRDLFAMSFAANSILFGVFFGGGIPGKAVIHAGVALWCFVIWIGNFLLDRQELKSLRDKLEAE